ncbi:MAG: ice-binding family protein [Thermoplasmatota archaeon]
MIIVLMIGVFSFYATIPAKAAGPTPVDLGTADDFVILSKSGISTTGTTSITGDIGVSPAAATFITGFDLIIDPSNEFSTSSMVTGRVYAADYTPPTPSKMTTAVSDMETAYADANGRTSPDHTELGAGDITSMTLSPGLYKWGTGVLISAGGVTISGSENDVWIFQIAQDLTVADGAIVTLSGGAQPSNIFWQVAGEVAIGTTAQMKGNILCQTQIVMNTGATLNGRVLSQTAVILDANSITAPTAASSAGNSTPGFETVTIFVAVFIGIVALKRRK